MKRQLTICDLCGRENAILNLPRSGTNFPWKWTKMTLERYSMGTERWVSYEIDLCADCSKKVATFLGRDPFFNILDPKKEKDDA